MGAQEKFRQIMEAQDDKNNYNVSISGGSDLDSALN